MNARGAQIPGSPVLTEKQHVYFINLIYIIMRIIFLLAAFLFSATMHTAAAQGKAPQASSQQKIATVVIQTSAQCGMCKKTIESGLASLQGVESAVLNLSSKKVRVRYYRNQTNADAIRRKIAAVGYDADTVAADPKAYQALPACCQKGGHD